MNYPQDRPNKSNKSIAVLLTITLHLALGYFLFTQASKASDQGQSKEKQELVSNGTTRTP